jgi:hypothetical protein
MNMIRYIALSVLLQLLVVSPPVQGADVERTEETEKVLRFGGAGGERLVVVDNLFGSIEVKGYDGEEVRVNIQKTIVARSNEKAARAEEEITLEVYENDDVIELYVDGPFRDKRKREINWRGFRFNGYRVIYNFELEIPKDCAVELTTVDEGDISVRSIAGDFDVQHVNGRIDMKGIRGSGEVYSVNGKLTIEFEDNPTRDCLFGTVNGDVRLYFQSGLSADFYMKTMNGEAYTDFDMAALPFKTTTSNSRNGKKVYKVGHMTGVRAGKGGPEIELKTLKSCVRAG